MREVDFGLKVSSHAFMVGELTSIVVGDRVNPVPMRKKSLGDGTALGLRGLVNNALDHGVKRFTLHQRYQGATMAFADHRVAFPITKATTGIEYAWTLI